MLGGDDSTGITPLPLGGGVPLCVCKCICYDEAGVHDAVWC
jgi:hypothetical protein